MIRFNCPNCGHLHEVYPALAKLPLICKRCGQRVTAPEASTAPPAAPPPVAPVPKPPPPVAPPIPAPPVVAAQPAPKTPVTPAPPAAPAAPVAPRSAPAKPRPEEDDDDVLVTKADSSPDIDFNVGGPTAASLSDAARARPAGSSDPKRTRPDMEIAPAAEPDSSPVVDLEALLPPEPAPAPEPPRDAPADEPPEPKAEPILLPFVADLVVFVALVFAGTLVGEQLTHKPTMQVISEAGSAPQFPPPDLLIWGAPPLLLGLIYLLLNSRARTVGAWIRRRGRRGATEARNPKKTKSEKSRTAQEKHEI